MVTFLGHSACTNNELTSSPISSGCFNRRCRQASITNDATSASQNCSTARIGKVFPFVTTNNWIRRVDHGADFSGFIWVKSLLYISIPSLYFFPSPFLAHSLLQSGPSNPCRPWEAM